MTSEADSLMQALADPARLDELTRSGLMDSEIERSFDRAVRHASRVLGTPVSLLSLVDDERQFFKAQIGLSEPTASERETPLSHSFCQHVVATGEPFVVEDAREHPLVRDNLAVRDLDVIAYLGVPIVTSNGQVLGSFCAIQDTPRTWTDDDMEVLKDMAAGVVSEINLRMALERERHTALERDAMLREVNHRVKNLFSLVPIIVRLSARSGGSVEDVAGGIEARVSALARSHALTLNTFSEDAGIAIDGLVRAVLEPYASQQDAFTIDGPALRLASSDGNTLGLALHELATNAAKYGALAKQSGHIAIRWRVHEADAPRLELHWTEGGGPPVEAPPEGGGFGTVLIDRIIELSGGSIERDWRRSGLTVTLAMPLRKNMSGPR